MNCPAAVFRYRGANPGADTNDYVLFATTDQPVELLAAMTGAPRITVSILGDTGEGGTLRLSASRDRGVTWNEVHLETVTFVASEAQVYDFQIVEYRDIRLVWRNDGNAKTTFLVNMSLTTEHGPSQ